MKGFEYASKEQKVRHLQRTREWNFLYVVVGAFVVGSGILFWTTGTEYLPDFF